MEKIGSWLDRYWLLAFSLSWGLFVALPFLAPIFMHLGWEGAGRTIYGMYSLVCHQLPQRSFFLLGPKPMYSLAEIQAVFQPTNNPALLRQFIGNSAVGWKVAWSDRMFAMYTAMLPAAWIWYSLRRKLGRLPVWGLLLFLLPMAIDGTAHLISDFAGVGLGFRDSNAWLAALTGNSLPASFYAGDALGSFNSLVRMLSGVFFAIGLVWFGAPYVEEALTSY
jgi:uncharacterized membrane protein